MKNAVVIVPHADDELLVGGSLLYALGHSNEWCVKLVFVSNSDYYSHEAEIRLNEALLVSRELGLLDDDVIFLGYGDTWLGKHLYNSKGSCVSKAGKSYTYALVDHPEYCFEKWKIHHEYTKENMKSDIISVIKDYYPNLIICVDFDRHPDHRAVSLIFQEAIHDILKQNLKYKPLILKKLAYENVMDGKKDYYCLPHSKTYNDGNRLYSTPILKWDERICFEVPKECNTLRLIKNPLYKAAALYKSQRIKFRMESAINADIVFWRMPSENLALEAEIEVSSGNGTYINDMKTIDSRDINEKKCRLDAATWIPEKTDKRRSVRLLWKKRINISQIVFFENPSENNDINSLLIILNDKVKLSVTNINHDGSANIIAVNEQSDIYSVEFVIVDSKNNAGITEIAVYSRLPDMEDYNLPCKIIRSDKNGEDTKIGYISRFVSWIEKMYCKR